MNNRKTYLSLFANQLRRQHKCKNQHPIDLYQISLPEQISVQVEVDQTIMGRYKDKVIYINPYLSNADQRMVFAMLLGWYFFYSSNNEVCPNITRDFIQKNTFCANDLGLFMRYLMMPDEDFLTAMNIMELSDNQLSNLFGVPLDSVLKKKND